MGRFDYPKGLERYEYLSMASVHRKVRPSEEESTHSSGIFFPVITHFYGSRMTQFISIAPSAALTSWPWVSVLATVTLIP